MKCPKCQADISDDSRFCSKCGTPIHPSDEAFISQTRTILRPMEELHPGTTLADKYKIIEVLGRGGMGIVYKAEDTKLKRSVALKFLPPELIQNEEARERFVLEAQTAAALSHPNICTIHEINEQNGKSFIAMEYVKGQSLKAKIEKGPLELDEALNISIQVAEGLEEAHKRGIIHRDIKSINIMVTDKGQAKVMDFGLAKVKGATLLTREGTTLGTVAYMSPEQARGEKVDHRSDIWSLGIVMYEMLSGELPFKGDREASILYSVVHEEPEPLKKIKRDLSPELQQIINRAMKKKPESRYSSAAEMLKDLRKYQDSLRAEELGVFNLRTILRRLRRPMVAIPAICALIIIALASFWFFNRQAKIRWARQEALPQIERMIAENNCWRDLVAVYKLAEDAEKIIPHDPKLTKLFSQCSLRIDIRTEPPGAMVTYKDYGTPDGEWIPLGATPIEKVRLPIGIFRWKFEKDGYEPVLAAASTWLPSPGAHDIIGPNDLTRILDKTGAIPPGMVRVKGEETAHGKIPDFFIDRCEVTNCQFKEFVAAGGYRNKKFWTQKFVKDGRELSWEEAVGSFVDQTGLPGPSTWQSGDYPEGQAEYPVSGVSWYEAAAYAEFADKALPTSDHWGIARGEYTTLILVPQLGGFAIIAPFSNFRGKASVPVGSLPGMTAYGALDMAGNVREWCWNEAKNGRMIRGGAWGDNPYMFSSLSQAPAMERSPKDGFRRVFYPDPKSVPQAVFQAVRPPEVRNLYKEKPVSDAVFQVYKEQFSYDRMDLQARVESRDERPDWIHETVSFDAAYGGERVLAHLFLPRNAAPPYQAVVYFPGSESINQRSSREIETYYEFPMFLSFIVKNGRAVLYPVYKGTFERGNDALAALLNSWDRNSHQYVDVFIQDVKDLRRSVDYLEDRPEIDGQKIAYYGMSWGAWLGVYVTAVEDRFKASILTGGGIDGLGRPEIKDINYVQRVKVPTLLLNGRYDTINPVDTHIKPLFDLLGTPSADKRLELFETDHIPPYNEYVKETLAWLDKYLGPVNR